MRTQIFSAYSTPQRKSQTFAVLHQPNECREVHQLSDLIGAWYQVDNAVSLRWGLVFLAPMGFWATWHFFVSTRTIERDQARAIGGAE